MSGHTQAEIVIDAPRSFVYDRTNDLSIWPEMFTEYSAVEVLERDDDGFLFRLTTKPDEDGKVYSWISRRRLIPDEWRIEAHRVEPLRPFSDMQIRWGYDEVGSGTRLRWEQEFTVHPEAPFDEAAAERYISAGSRVQMAAIKEYLEGAWRRAQASRSDP